MSDYRKYMFRAIGLRESAASDVPSLSDIDKEQDEHPQLSRAEAALIAKQHAKLDEISAFQSPMYSPTAIPTPIIGGAVRGSSSGGLPSGADRNSDISPSRLGGYKQVGVSPVNSLLVNKTPANSEINRGSMPINDDPSLTGGVTHPFQVQKDAGNPPQAVTGASMDGDAAVKPTTPTDRSIDVSIAQEGEDEDNNADNPDFQKRDAEQFRKDRSASSAGDDVRKELGMNETFARHTELLKKKLAEGKHKSGCKCGFCANKGKFKNKNCCWLCWRYGSN
jgi:hypothetical protein